VKAADSRTLPVADGLAAASTATPISLLEPAVVVHCHRRVEIDALAEGPGLRRDLGQFVDADQSQFAAVADGDIALRDAEQRAGDDAIAGSDIDGAGHDPCWSR
jgi:hypothetical protein